jgi:two-component sensor histidine kinase
MSSVLHYFRLLLIGLFLVGGALRSTAGTSPEARKLNNQAKMCFRDNPERALALAKQAEEVASAARDLYEQAWAVSSQGSANYILEHYDEALRAYLRAIALHRRAGDKRGESACLNNLGNLYYSHDQFEPAYDYYMRSLRLDRQRGDSAGVATSYVNLANVLAFTQRLPEAMEFNKRGLALARYAGDRQEESSALNNLGSGYVDMKLYDEALKYLHESLQLNKELGNVAGESVSLQTMADAYAGLHQWEKAVAYYHQSSLVGHDFITTVRDNYRRLAQAQAASGDYRNAYASFRRYTALNDSIFTRETADKLTEVQTEYRTREQQQQIQGQRARLRAQNVALHHKNQLVALASGAAVLLLLGAGGLAHQVRQKNRANQLLATANAEIRQVVAQKETLIQEVHHRVKNNLQMVSSLLTLQASADPAARPAVVESQARIQSMALVHEYLYRADDLAQIRLDTYLEELLTSLVSAHTSTTCPLQLTTDLAPLIVGAKDAIPLGLLVNELITNACKHAFRGRSAGHLRVTLAELPVAEGKGGLGFSLQLCDDGVGLPAHAPQPTGPPSLGMQLVRMFSRQLKATLITTPIAEGGTCFEVRRG